jgi:hypothetical protein
MKFNRPETIKSHEGRKAAINAAGDFGMIYDVKKGKEYQVHALSNYTNGTFAEGKNEYSAMNKKMSVWLREQNLIEG